MSTNFRNLKIYGIQEKNVCKMHAFIYMSTSIRRFFKLKDELPDPELLKELMTKVCEFFIRSTCTFPKHFKFPNFLNPTHPYDKLKIFWIQNVVQQHFSITSTKLCFIKMYHVAGIFCIFRCMKTFVH